MWRRRQRLDWCTYKPRDVSHHQKVGEKHETDSLSEPLVGTNLAIPRFQTSSFQDGERINFCCFLLLSLWGFVRGHRKWIHPAVQQGRDHVQLSPFSPTGAAVLLCCLKIAEWGLGSEACVGMNPYPNATATFQSACSMPGSVWGLCMVFKTTTPWSCPDLTEEETGVQLQ